MNQNVKQEIFEVSMSFTHTKKFIPSHLLRSGSGSGSDQKGPDPTGSGSATLLVCEVGLPVHGLQLASCAGHVGSGELVQLLLARTLTRHIARSGRRPVPRTKRSFKKSRTLECSVVRSRSISVRLRLSLRAFS
jgi:hypothetical protein